jgi:hypothetical protein
VSLPAPTLLEFIFPQERQNKQVCGGKCCEENRKRGVSQLESSRKLLLVVMLAE